MSGQHTNKNKKLWIILLIIFLVLLIASVGAIVITRKTPDNKLSKKYKNDSDVPTSSDVETLKKKGKLPDNPIDFKTLQKDNNDVIGWITVDGTPIDYPILMSGYDKEEDFYINHDFNAKSYKAGSIYVQRDNSNDFTDFNTVIYGHNMMNGSMFGTLKKFRNKDFFNTNRNIYVYIPGHILHYEIVSAFIHDDRHLLSAYSFYTKEGRMEYAEVCKNPNTLVKNIVDGLTITDNDRLITLSTCTSAENERYLVVGKLIRDVETK